MLLKVSINKIIDSSFVTIIIAIANCSRVVYTVQPPTKLKCNHVGKILSLVCNIKHSNHGLHNVTWYWSRRVHDAGVNGTAILPGDKNDVYGIEGIQHHLYSDLHISSDLHFLVNNSTLGYYWCEISGG